jgi:hypothetical protein
MLSNHKTSEGGEWDGICIIALTRVELDPDFVTRPQIQDNHICSRLVRSATVGKSSDLGDAVLNDVNIDSAGTVGTDSDVEDEETLCWGGEHPRLWVIAIPFIVEDAGEDELP